MAGLAQRGGAEDAGWPGWHSRVELKMQGGRAGTAGWRGGVADLGEGQAVSSFAAKRPSDFHECP